MEVCKLKHIKIWVDDIRTPPTGYFWTKTVKNTIIAIEEAEFMGYKIDEISLDHDAGEFDHDAGEYAEFGGDYIKLLDWLEETGRNYPIHIHSMNVVGVENMRRIIQRNGWKEV